MFDLGDFISWGVALLAALGAVVVGKRQGDLQERVTKIEEARREEEVEEAKIARVHVEFDLGAKDARSQPCIVISNDGPADARDIAFDPSTLPGLRVSPGELPIRHLVAGKQYAPIDWAIQAQRGRNLFDLTVTWTDGSGPREETFRLRARNR